MKVTGYCPMGCGNTLFVGSGGHLTCSWLKCPNPTLVGDMVGNPDAILAALAEVGVLIEENDSGYRYIEATGGEVHGPAKIRYVSPWKEAK